MTLTEGGLAMRIIQITTNDELNKALIRMEKLWESKDVKELEELDTLATLINDYEDKMIIEDRKNTPEIEVKINDL
jgi:antitoxin component HigA of HigAB toxin-antitoxin module